MERNSTLICAPLMGSSIDQMLMEMNEAKKNGADVVEIRLDYLKNFRPRQDLQRLIKECPLQTLITFRPKWEGGQYEGDETERLDALRLAIELGADYIDVELQVAHEFINSIHGKKPENSRVIVSSHNYHCTPSTEEIGDLVATIQATGADMVKIATTALEITDVLHMFQITVHSYVPIIGLVMTERGLISRLLCPKFGGYLTFGTLEAGKVSAPGQPTIKDLLDLYNVRQIGPDTKVFGIIGNPVGHSKGPVLYNKVFQSVGFDGIYVPFLVDDVANFLNTYSSPDFAGFSCTIPHKEAAIKCCDEVDPIAKSIGAVNIIIRRQSDGKLIGYNSDYIGSIDAIEEALKGSLNMKNATGSPLAGKLVVVVGAGGAGKSIAYGAKAKGARVVIANRTYDRARQLASLVGGDAIPLAELDSFHPEDGMILANATCLGMQPKVDETPISKQALSAYSLVFDAVYTPKMTRLLQEAKESGAIVVTGLEMFMGQSFEQFEKFTGLPGFGSGVVPDPVQLGSTGRITLARNLFDEMPQRDSIAWNAMLTSYSKLGLPYETLTLFSDMRFSGTQLDDFTFTAALSASADVRDFHHGSKLHALVISSGYQSSLPVCNSLIDMYGKCLVPSNARRVFEEMSCRNDVSWCSLLFAYVKRGDLDSGHWIFVNMPNQVEFAWNILIAGYSRNGKFELCMDLFRKMRGTTCKPDLWTFTALMNACSELPRSYYGQMIHGCIIKTSWSSEIEALSFFINMMRNLLRPDEFTFGAVLHGCSSLAVQGPGKMVHGCIIQYGFHSYAYVGNGLVNMYAKCGDIEGSCRAFSDIIEKDLVTWNTMLFGFGLHGRAVEALRLYEEMATSRIKPDKVTFIGLLMTCSHSGLIEQGQVIFESMESVYGVPHEADHVACMVDMLGRGGYLHRARELVEDYSRKLNITSREALLGACAAHGDISLGVTIGEDLMISNPRKEIGYVLLSNLYCASGQWKEAERVRKAMVEQGLKKTPGCSWIELKNKVLVFVAGSHSHPDTKEMYKMLKFLQYEMRNPSNFGFENYKAFQVSDEDLC
ncbi:Dehydroquinase class I [Macleaya cordata]|uniref:Dehydroquinase class I n=1 Tax=Macleaya cordata TaxID=56857 RepID=A0A200Q1P6_MACCD|nr:Dehydroquinase class I [Macleaya cordata]